MNHRMRCAKEPAPFNEIFAMTVAAVGALVQLLDVGMVVAFGQDASNDPALFGYAQAAFGAEGLDVDRLVQDLTMSKVNVDRHLTGGHRASQARWRVTVVMPWPWACDRA